MGAAEVVQLLLVQLTKVPKLKFGVKSFKIVPVMLSNYLMT